MQINVSNRDAVLIAVSATVLSAAFMYPDAAAGLVSSFGEWLAGVAA